MATIERLYELYNIIADSNDDFLTHESEYQEIISGVKSGSAERRLSSQFIAKFFHLYPNLQEQALNSQFDLCEDDDIQIRKQAIKDLPTFCKNKPDVIPKVADVLSQLLQVDDPTEITAVHNSLFSLLKMEAKGTLTGIFYEIENSMNEVVTERLLKFLHSKIRTLVSDVFNSECEELVLRQSRSVVSHVTSEEELLLIMGILKELKINKSLKGYQQMVDIVEEQCNITQKLSVADMEKIHRMSSCVKQALPFFSSQIRSTKFFEFMCREVIPIINEIVEKDACLALELLRTLSEMAPHTGVVENIQDKVLAVFSQLLEEMPLPPQDEPSPDSPESELVLEFSRVECLLFLFHHLAKNHTEFLTENPERLKDFKIRLQYFARGSQAYQKQLRETLGKETGDKLKTDENRIKLIALKTTANINTLIKDLFHSPPSYKANLTFSWKESDCDLNKKRSPITFDGPQNVKSAKNDREIYAPPRDKYSRSAGQYVARGRGRGRGGWPGARGYRGFSRY